jgi:hypothetical protein
VVTIVLVSAHHGRLLFISCIYKQRTKTAPEQMHRSGDDASGHANFPHLKENALL